MIKRIRWWFQWQRFRRQRRWLEFNLIDSGQIERWQQVMDENDLFGIW